MIVFLVATTFLVIGGLGTAHAELVCSVVKNISSDVDTRVLNGVERNGISNPVFLGGTQNVTIEDLGSPNNEMVNLGVCYSASPSGCYNSQQNDANCDNFIRSWINLDPNCTREDCSVLVCGTNALIHKCYICTHNTLDNDLICPDITTIVNKPEQSLTDGNRDNDFNATCLNDRVLGNGFPREKDENATLLYTRDGVNGKVFFGVKENKLNGNSLIGTRTMNSSTGVMSDEIRTRSDSQKMVKTEAHFVGMPFSNGMYTYILFREIALEYQSLSGGQTTTDTYFSRIARFCTNDAGVDVSSTQTFTSFLKQRLLCYTVDERVDGVEFRTHYDEIRDFVTTEENGIVRIHAVFTTSEYDAPASALCTYNLMDVLNTFQTGDFFGANSAADIWASDDGTNISPRIGFDCSIPNTASTNFQRDFNLMFDGAEPERNGQEPNVYVIDGDRVNALKINGSDYILASEGGCFCQLPLNFSAVEEEEDLICQRTFEGVIRDLELVADGQMLVTTEEGPRIVTCTTVVPTTAAPPGIVRSPSGTNFTVRPNTWFQMIIQYPYDTNCEQIETLENNKVVPEGSRKKCEKLADEDLFRLELLVLNADLTIIFLDQNVTVSTYGMYSEGELGARCEEWDDHNEAHTQLNQTNTCGSATSTDPGTFNATILEYVVQSCDDCTYSDCVSNCQNI